MNGVTKRIGQLSARTIYQSIDREHIGPIHAPNVDPLSHQSRVLILVDELGRAAGADDGVYQPRMTEVTLAMFHEGFGTCRKPQRPTSPQRVRRELSVIRPSMEDESRSCLPLLPAAPAPDSFVAEAFNWIETGRFTGGPYSEQQTNTNRNR